MPDEKLKIIHLDSGLRVLTRRLPRLRSVSLGLWINTGSRDEGPESRGLSHFVEHMLFKGTPTRDARSIAEAFDNMGADLNAATGRENTSVYTRVLDEYLEGALEVIWDMIRNPLFSARDVDSERMVVLEEISMHLDSPDEIVHDLLFESLWGGHPLGHSVLGDRAVIESVDGSTLRDFFAERYVASRVVVAAVGSVDVGRIEKAVERLSEGMQSGKASSRNEVPDWDPASLNVLSKDTEQAHVALGAKGLPRNHPDRFALSLMDNILGGSMSSRLFQRIREELGLAYAVYSFAGMYTGMGMVGIYCGTAPSQAQRVIELIEEELAGVKEKGFTLEERERALKHTRGALVISMEESGHMMNRIAKVELSGGEHLSVDEMVDRLEKVTLDQIYDVFMNTWGSDGLSLAVVGPVREGELGLTGRFQEVLH